MSRNSTSVAWVPTATMSAAPLSSASSIATSSLVPVAGKTTGSTPERPHPLEPGRAAVAVGVHDDLGAAAQRVVGHRVHVADDEVGLVPRLDERVGAAVDADEHRLVLADVVAQGLRGRPCSGSRARRSARAGRRGRCGCRARRPRRRAARAPCAGSPSCSAAKASSWSDRPARARVMASWTASLSSTVAVGDGAVGGAHRAVLEASARCRP